MRTQLVLTLIGQDRPGLVELLAKEVARAGGNWEQSRMAQLDDKFAGILRVSVPHERADELSAAVRALERQGLRIVIEASTAAPRATPTRAMQIELVGDDREGIVRDISRVLFVRGINVDELHTRCEAAPMGGAQLFRATAKLHVPSEVNLSELRKALEAIADDLVADLSLEEVARKT